MRILAVDPGSKRVGVALSDPSATIAQALVTIRAEPSGTLASRLAEIARTHEAGLIVVGLPRRLDGSRGPEAAAAETLAASIRRASGLPVELVDERFSSVAAERSLVEGGVRRAKRRATVDRVAAALMLQAHLDRRKSRAATGRRVPTSKDQPADA
jgi:putative pre-16S rRNA nuclease